VVLLEQIERIDFMAIWKLVDNERSGTVQAAYRFTLALLYIFYNLAENMP